MDNEMRPGYSIDGMHCVGYIGGKGVDFDQITLICEPCTEHDRVIVDKRHESIIDFNKLAYATIQDLRIQRITLMTVAG